MARRSLTERPLFTRSVVAPIDDIEISDSAEGRTVIARALTYNRNYEVTDNGRDFFVEAYAPSVFTKSIIDRAGKDIDLFYGHDNRTPPVGLVMGAEPDPEAFVFRAEVFDSPAGENMLAVLKRRSGMGVSIGARIYKVVERGGVRLYQEARLEEISFTTQGQMSDAKVLAVRHTYNGLDIPEFAQMADANALAVRADIGDPDDEGTLLVEPPPVEVDEQHLSRLETEAWLNTLVRPWDE